MKLEINLDVKESLRLRAAWSKVKPEDELPDWDGKEKSVLEWGSTVKAVFIRGLLDLEDAAKRVEYSGPNRRKSKRASENKQG